MRKKIMILMTFVLCLATMALTLTNVNAASSFTGTMRLELTDSNSNVISDGAGAVSKTLIPGEEITLSLYGSCSDPQGFFGMQSEITYDYTKVTCTAVKTQSSIWDDTALLKNASIINNIKRIPAIGGLALAPYVTAGEILVGAVTFKINSSVTGDLNFTLTPTVQKTFMMDHTGELMNKITNITMTNITASIGGASTSTVTAISVDGNLMQFSNDVYTTPSNALVPAASTTVQFKPVVDTGNGTIEPFTVGGQTFTPANTPDETFTIPVSGAGLTTSFTITVKAQDATTTKTYTVNIIQDKNNIASLSNLVFVQTGSQTTPTLYNAANTATTTFNSATLNYYLRIGSDTNTLKVTPTITLGVGIKGATVNGNALSGGSYTFTGSMPTVITVTVTAQNDTTASYSITVYQSSSDTSLKSVNVVDNKGTTLLYTKTNNDYIVNDMVDYTITGFKVTAVANHSNASVVITGQSGAGGFSLFGNGKLAITSTVTITVTSESGVVATYLVKCTREAADTDNTFPTSNGIVVKDINGNVLAGSWNGNTYTVTDNMLFSNSGFIIVPTTNSAVATITVNGVTIQSGSDSSVFTFDGSSTSKSVSVVVTSESGVSQTYTIVVNRESPSDIKTFTLNVYRSNNSPLTFKLTGSIYKINEILAFLEDYVYIQIILDDVKASFTIEGAPVSSGVKHKITLNNLIPQNTTSVNLVITAEDGTTSSSTIEITRAGADVNTSLSLMDVVGLNDFVVYATSGVVGNTYSYDLPLASGHKFKLDLVASATTSKIYVSTVVGSLGTLYSGAGIIYNVGDIVYITVEAQSLTKQVYVIKTQKVDERDTDNSLDIIKVLGYESAFTFNQSTYTYSLSVPFSVKQITLFVKATSTKATLEITPGQGIQNVAVGANVFSIRVKAENGSYSATYTLTVTRSEGNPDNYVESLKVNGAAVSNFSQYTNEYTVVVSRNTTNATIAYTFSPTATASITPSNSQTLQAGRSTIFYITITSEKGETNKYTVIVYAADTDKSLTNIELLAEEFGASLLNSNGDLAYTFAPGNSTLVTIHVPYTTTSLYIQLTKGRFSTASLSGLKNLIVGDNGIFIIYVTSEYGMANTNLDDPQLEQSTQYRIKIIRDAADTENRLQTLSATIDGVEQISGFTPDTITITIENVVPTATMLFLSGTTMSRKAKIISGMGGIDISGLGSASSGTILTSVIVESESGVQKEYKIIISREVIVLDDNNAISNITVVDSNGKTHIINFVDSTTSYTINVPGSTASATITVKTPAGAKSTVTGAGVHILNTGGNAITVYATSESGKQGTVYTINFMKAAVSNDATLSDIRIDGATITGFSPTMTNYTINVGNATASIDIDAVVNNAMASISGGTGNVNLNVGNNSYSITVRAEDGTTKVYIINVVRDAKTTLDDLSVEDYAISPIFNSQTLNYTLSVPYSVNQAVIMATASNPTFVTITGTGNVNLSEGVNTFNVIVRANSGATTTYVITITRTAGNPDNYLTDLAIDGNPVEGFSQTVTTYTIILPRDKTFTSFVYHCSATATATEITDTSLSFGKNTKEIIVTSETGQTRKYTLYIYCADEEFAIDDILLTTQNGNTLNNAAGDEAFTYNQTILEYNFNVPFSTSSFNIEIIPHSDYAKLFLSNGLKNLNVGLNTFLKINVGLNTFTVYAQSEYGVSNPSAPNTISQKYVIKITRNAVSNDSSLKSLSVIISNVEKIANFDPATKTYVIENIGDTATSAKIFGVANDLTAVVIGNGTKTLNQGSITDGFVFNFIVKVTAEDGTYTEYTITISRYGVNLSEDNTITGLLLFDSSNKYYLDDASFDPAVLRYTITIPFGPRSYTITPEKLPMSPATLSGGGSFTITAADYGTTKTHMVFATSENGVKGVVYEITVKIESPSTNSTLLAIMVDGILLPGFQSNKFDGYVLTRAHGSVSTDIKATLADKLSSVRGIGTFALVEGPNTFAIVVTAQDGSISTYTILINRAYADPYLNNLMVSGEQLLDSSLKAVTFDPFTLEYHVVVSYIKLSCEIIASAPAIIAAGGQIKGDGSKNLQVGDNEFTITVISANSTITEYTLIITRRGETSTNTNILSAKIDEITQFAEDFKNNKDKNYFEYEVGNDITKLTVSVIVENQGDANNESATYFVYGSNLLKVGVNDVIILITASDNETTRAIVVRVTRLPMTFEVIEDKYDALKVSKTDEENVYNMKIGKNNLSTFDFKQYIKSANNLIVDVMTDLTKSCSEVLVRVTDGDEIKIVRFVITDKVESINYVFYIIAGVCAIILAGILVAVNRDKYGKVTKNRKQKAK